MQRPANPALHNGLCVWAGGGGATGSSQGPPVRSVLHTPRSRTVAPLDKARECSDPRGYTALAGCILMDKHGEWNADLNASWYLLEYLGTGMVDWTSVLEKVAN